MTFKILNDEAREQIAAHIFGAAPAGHNRAGSVSGTDAPAKSYEPPPPKYGGKHKYKPGGSGPTGSRGEDGTSMCLVDINLPPGHPAALPVPPNHDGKCPPNSGTLTYQLLNAGTPQAICCPSYNQDAAQDGPGGSPGGVRPPTGQMPVIQCPSGMQQGNPLGAVTRGSTRFAQYTSECSNNGGTLTESQSSPGIFVCCRPDTPSEPPSGTGTGTGSVEEDRDYPAAWDGICSVAAPLADIAAKSWGWVQVQFALGILSSNCTNVAIGTFSERVSSSDTSCINGASQMDHAFAYNPGGTTVSRDQSVVVVRQDTSDSYMTRAIIVVVPCT